MEYVFNTLNITRDIIVVHIVVNVGIVIIVIVVVVVLVVIVVPLPVSVVAVVPISGVAVASVIFVVAAAVLSCVDVVATFVAATAIVVIVVVIVAIVRTVAFILYFLSHLYQGIVNSVRVFVPPRHSLVALLQLFSEICLISTTAARWLSRNARTNSGKWSRTDILRLTGRTTRCIGSSNTPSNYVIRGFFGFCISRRY